MPLSIPKHGYYKQKICSTLSAHPRYVFCKAKKIVQKDALLSILRCCLEHYTYKFTSCSSKYSIHLTSHAHLWKKGKVANKMVCIITNNKMCYLKSSLHVYHFSTIRVVWALSSKVRVQYECKCATTYTTHPIQQLKCYKMRIGLNMQTKSLATSA